MEKKIQENISKTSKKWLSVPFGIIVVLCAGASYNLFAYFQQVGTILGFGKETMGIIKYTVLFGYYFGLLPGLFVQGLGGKFAFIMAAIMALVSFAGLGWIAEKGDGTKLEWILMITLLFVGAMSGAIATVATIIISVTNFPKKSGMLIVVIMMGYYKVAPYFEYSTRAAFFAEANLLYYFAASGLILAIVYIAAAFLVEEQNIDDSIHAAIAQFDGTGLMIFVLLEAICLAAYYVTALLYDQWMAGAIIFYVFIVFNFLALGVLGKTIADTLKSGKVSLTGKIDKHNDKSFGAMLGQPKYLCLMLSTFLVVGVCQTYNFNIFQICFSYNKAGAADHIIDTFWIADMSARFGGGLLAYLLSSKINGYLFAALGALTGAVGFGISLLGEPVGASFIFISCILIGICLGTWWVIVPQIVMDDAGPKNFGLNWGLAMFLNALGILAFGQLFDWIYGKQGDGSDKCAGEKCILVQFIIFGVLCLLGVILSYIAFTKDDPAGQEPKDEKKDKKGKKEEAKSSGKDRGRSKDSKKGGKGEKSAKKDKSDAKTKDTDKKTKEKSANKEKPADKEKSAKKEKSASKKK